MNKFRYIVTLFLMSSVSFGQNNTIKGTVRDYDSKFPISYVNILIQEHQLSTSSDISGKFSFSNLSSGEYSITFSHLGYKSVVRKIFLRSDEKIKFEIYLEKSELMLGDAVVTSTRGYRIVKDVPLPIELIDEKTIEQSIKISTSDLIEKAPGVSLVSDGSWATGVNIRGLSGQNIVYLIDGNRIETSTNISAGLSLIDLYNVKDIEIIKGGLSSLYGTGATGGVVNIRTNPGTSNNNLIFTGSINSSYTSVNEGKTGSMNLNISDRHWYAAITGTLREAEDTKIPGGTLTNSGFNDNSISALVGIVPNDNIELILNYQKFKANNVGIPGGSPFPQTATATYKYAGREMFSGEIVFKQLIPSLSNLKFKYYTQLIGREVEIIPNPNAVIEPEADHNTDGLLLQTDWTLDNNHFLITGIEAWQRSYKGERSIYIIPQNSIVIDKPVPNSKFKTLGIFAQDELHLLNNILKLKIGARYDFINVTNEQTNNPVLIITDGNEIVPPPNSDASYDAYDVKNNSWSGNVGILYSVLENTNLTFNAAYNFRASSLEERYQYIDLGGTQYYGNPNLEPEKGLFYDFGFRIWKEKYTFTADGFLNLFTDLVIDQLQPNGSYKKENVGKSTLIGFDARLDYNFYERNVFYTSIAYVNGKDIETEEYLPQIPPLNGIIGFRMPVAKIFEIDFSCTIYNEQNKISSDESTTPGYVYFDIAFDSYPIDMGIINIQIFAGVQNIFNKSYKSHLSTYRGVNLTEPGRNIYAKLKLNW